jgi:hypothetical protein
MKTIKSKRSSDNRPETNIGEENYNSEIGGEDVENVDIDVDIDIDVDVDLDVEEADIEVDVEVEELAEELEEIYIDEEVIDEEVIDEEVISEHIESHEENDLENEDTHAQAQDFQKDVAYYKDLLYKKGFSFDDNKHCYLVYQSYIGNF